VDSELPLSFHYNAPSYTLHTLSLELCCILKLCRPLCNVRHPVQALGVRISWLEVVKAIPKQGFVLLARASLLPVVYAFSVCSVSSPCFWLSVLVQSIAWKDSSLK